MSSRWDGKIGKIPKIGDKRESKRFSPRLTGVEPEFHECRQPEEDYQRSDNGTRRSPGAAELYTPETVGQYKSQWARYQRALTLNPASIVQQGKKILYKFESCDSVTGFWEVEVSSGATYLNITRRVLQILCPRPIILDMIESDGETFTWTQTRGKRTAELNGIFLKASEQSPAFGFEPQLDILSFCLDGNGCADDSVEPIVLNVQPEGQPELFDSVTIYTTPTEINGGIAFTCIDFYNKVFPIPAPASLPIYLQKGYLKGDRGFSWNPPSIDSEYVIGYVVQQNITGQYVDIQSFGLNTPTFIGQAGTYYRIKILFSSFGLDYESYSDNLLYPSAFTPSSVLIDDSLYRLSFSFLNNTISDLPLAVQRLEPTDIDKGLSFGYLSNSIVDLPLSTKKIESISENYSGISFTFLGNEIKDIALGGVIIS